MHTKARTHSHTFTHALTHRHTANLLPREGCFVSVSRSPQTSVPAKRRALHVPDAQDEQELGEIRVI